MNIASFDMAKASDNVIAFDFDEKFNVDVRTLAKLAYTAPNTGKTQLRIPKYRTVRFKYWEMIKKTRRRPIYLRSLLNAYAYFCYHVIVH